MKSATVYSETQKHKVDETVHNELWNRKSTYNNVYAYLFLD